MSADGKPVTVSAATRLSRALELHPDVLDYIVSLDPHDFERLRHPTMRRLMSPRITLGRVAAMTGTPLQALLERVAALGGAVAELADEAPRPQSPSGRPDWVPNADAATRTVDLLPLDEALEADPMPPVMLEVKKLRPGEVLLVRHKWEPQPFYDVWAKMPGLEWFSEAVGEGEWHIWVRRT